MRFILLLLALVFVSAQAQLLDLELIDLGTPELDDDGDTAAAGSGVINQNFADIETAVNARVDTANSPAANEFARFTDTDTIEGLTFAEMHTALGRGFAYTTSDQTEVGTSYADVTGLGMAVAANTVYHFHCGVWADADAATTGIDLAVNGPAAPTFIVYDVEQWIGSTQLRSERLTAYDVNTGVTASAGTNIRLWQLQGVLQNGANAGTLIPRIKREAVGTGPNVRSGSWCRWSVI